MITKTSAIVLLTATLGATSVFAQSDTTTQTQAPETTTEETAETPAQPVPETDETFPVAEDTADVEDGKEYIKEVHGDWQIRCIKGSEDSTCTLYQLLKDDKGNSVAEFNVVALPKGGKATAGVSFVSPLGTLLTAKARIRVDSGKVRAYDYSWCENSGCVARFGLTEGEMNTLKRGAKAVMTIVAIGNPQAPISLDLSLNGITAAWNSVTGG